MTLVGYGDYYPKTNFGKILCILSAISGTVLVSFIVVAFTNSLKFTENEMRVDNELTKAFDQREKHDMKRIIEKRVGDLFLSIHRYHILKKKYINAVKFGVSNQKHIKRLRRNVEDALFLQIQFKRKFKNILQ
jgi:rRNA maturation protein Rpf1